MDAGISVEDALAVFSLEPGFSLQELKKRFREIALTVHPDRGGAQNLFETVKECFEMLRLEHRARAGGAPHDQLKRDFEADVSDLNSRNRRSADEFCLARFNAVFQDTRVPDRINDTGYGDWLQSAARVAARSKPKLDPKCSKEAFNRAFEKNVPVADESKSIVVRPIDASCGSTLALTEIGARGVDDYSTEFAYDCRLAHAERRTAVAPDNRAFHDPIASPEQAAALREKDLERGLSFAETLELELQREKEAKIDGARRAVELRRHARRAQAHARANRILLADRAEDCT